MGLSCAICGKKLNPEKVFEHKCNIFRKLSFEKIISLPMMIIIWYGFDFIQNYIQGYVCFLIFILFIICIMIIERVLFGFIRGLDKGLKKR